MKADGLPGWLIERMLAERDPDTGKSPLPWFERLFVERGVRVPHFYSRGVSLSVPVWSILDTGRPAEIRGNVEYDRYTLRAFDYLNFFPFYFRSALSKAADMPAVELLDDLGIPLLADRFGPGHTHQSFQLFQRGIRWEALKRAAGGGFPLRSPQKFLDEWQAGFALSNAVMEEVERDLLTALANEQVTYLDLFTGDFDHLGHLDNTGPALRAVAIKIDALAGRIWTAIEKSPLAAETLFVLVSDHGMNTDPSIYSQGYNLVDLLGETVGGAHHVLTNRHPLSEYKLRGLDPFVHRVVTASPASPYTGASHKDYPTALLDLDGNERAGLYLRNSDLNVIHLLLLQLERRDLPVPVRRATEAACHQAIAKFAAASQSRLLSLQPHLDALATAGDELLARTPVTTPGLAVPRAKARAASWRADHLAYQEARAAIARLASFDFKRRPAAAKLMPKRFIGEPNTLHQLQNYVVALAPEGLQLTADGRLDEARSFRRLNYFDFLNSLTVRNVVQAGVGNRPVDFVAVRIPAGKLPDGLSANAAVWVNAGPRQQLLILSRGPSGNRPGQLKVIPVADLREDAEGRLTFEKLRWGAGLPLALFEDEAFAVATAEREAWLAEWHSEHDWLAATHRTRYTNAVIGLAEHFRRDPSRSGFHGARGGFHWARRELVEADLLLLARDHWNFNVRGFNPGGNHGGFLRASTHAVLMLTGGGQTGLRPGVTVQTPYDSLSLVPTVLGLMGRCEPDLAGPAVSEATDFTCPAPR